jgi:hypothetical protein
MKQSEIELIAKKLVKYVEDHPNSTRGQIDRAVSPITSTITAWESIKHLFDYERYGARGSSGVTYKRNKVAYSREIVKRVYTKKPKPSSAIITLAKKMQTIVGESIGITGAEIREVMQIDNVMFKRASMLLKVQRRRSGKGTEYYPLGFKMPEMPVKEVEPKRVQPPRVNQFRFMVIAKTDLPILTNWVVTPPWLESRASN